MILNDFPPPPPAIIEIVDDPGGTLGERMAVTGWLLRVGVRVRVVGVCASACAWVLTLPKEQVCFSPQAWIGNHTHIGEPDDTIAWRRGNEFIADGYRRCGE